MIAGEFGGVRIYAVVPSRDVRAYLERHAEDSGDVDIEASLDSYESGILQTLQRLYPGARIAVRRQDQPTPEPPRTRVESDREGADTGEIEQEVVDLIAEFDFTECIVTRS